MTRRFVEACEGGDLDALMKLLAPDATYTGDGGGVVPNARRVVVGADNVARLLVALNGKREPGMSWRMVEVNGQPGLVYWIGAEPYGAITLAVAGGRVMDVYVVNNPMKLAGLRGNAPRA